MVDDAVLVVSELTTNVVLHARTRFLASLSRAEKHLLLAVTDASSALPRLAPGEGGVVGSVDDLHPVARRLLHQAALIARLPQHHQEYEHRPSGRG